MRAPIAPKRPKQISIHGKTWEDPWFGLREKDEPTLEYLKAENAYTEAQLADTKSFQEDLYREMRSRIQEDDSSVPEKDGEYFYYIRFEMGGQYPLYCRKKGSPSSVEEIYLDVPALAKGKDYFQIGVAEISPDHRYLAYAVDEDGSEKFTIRVKDLATGAMLPEEIPGAYYDLEWANDSKTFFYNLLDDNLRPRFVKRHRLGDDPAKDPQIFVEEDTRFFVSIAKSESQKYLFIESDGNNMSEVRYLPADRPESELTLVEKRRKDHEYSVSHHDARFFIRTNLGAQDFKIVTAPIEKPSAENWVDLVPHAPGTLVTGFHLFEKHLVVTESHRALPRARVMKLEDGSYHFISFPDEAYSLGTYAPREFESTTLRFRYSSFAVPASVYDYGMDTRKSELKKRQPVPDPTFDPANYVTKRVYARSHDGVEVPISLVHRKDTPLDGSAPLVLYGYGSYGIPMPVTFGIPRLSYVDRGFVYAIAHIRGGTDLGRQWYLDGKLGKKMNTFRDFIACAEHVIAAKYTSEGRIVAIGGSAGGMLMGAVANQRPELFGGIVAHVPFVDVINTMLDDSLPLTTMEYNEWGNPNERESFEHMMEYSPYDNVRAQEYPAILIVAGLNDPRVTYWEPAKWCAKLRETKTDSKLLVMKMHMESGHAGASGRFDHLKEDALDIAFACKALGAPTAKKA